MMVEFDRRAVHMKLVMCSRPSEPEAARVPDTMSLLPIHMDTQENKTLLSMVFAETAKGNGRPFLDALADDVCWTILGSTP
jgi:hypothetical protein